MTPASYVDILAGELRARQARNARYSLRAFARDCGLAACHLSEILRGREGLSRPKAQAVATSLGFDSAKAALFRDLAASLTAAPLRSAGERRNGRAGHGGPRPSRRCRKTCSRPFRSGTPFAPRADQNQRTSGAVADGDGDVAGPAPRGRRRSASAARAARPAPPQLPGVSVCSSRRRRLSDDVPSTAVREPVTETSSPARRMRSRRSRSTSASTGRWFSRSPTTRSRWPKS